MLERLLVDLPQDLTPYQLLACAVIRQAIEDARGSRHGRRRISPPRSRPRIASRLRRDAYAWFQGDNGFVDWCAVAGVDPAIVRARLAAPGSWRSRCGAE